MDVYGLTKEDFARLECASRSTYIDADGHEYYTLTYSEFHLCFQALIDAETYQIIDISLASGGNG